jgi:hypothetical protein
MAENASLGYLVYVLCSFLLLTATVVWVVSDSTSGSELNIPQSQTDVMLYFRGT